MRLFSYISLLIFLYNDKMDYSKITLGQLATLIEKNKKRASMMGLRISWGFTPQKEVYGKVFYAEQISFHKTYSCRDNPLHYITAEMQDDFANHMNELERDRTKINSNLRIERQEMQERSWRK